MADVLGIIGHSLLEAFFMLWITLWALILGFTLSGIVQSFASRQDLQKLMGDHKPKTIVRSSLLGIASSSCSYAATALAKSLFQRGADFTTAMVFMVASTNLVIELGIVLWLLIGWQFALAEFVGGTIMIVLFWLLAPRVFPARQIAAARERLNARAVADAHQHGVVGEEPDEDLPLRQRLRSRAGWVAAAGYAISDLKMLRKELLIGYLVAGVLAVVVPASIYSVVFFHGHGFWTDLENVIVGPFIAFISFVLCLLDRQRSAGCSAVPGWLKFRGDRRIHFRRPDHSPSRSHLREVLRLAPRAAPVLLVLGGDERCWSRGGLPVPPHPDPGTGATDADRAGAVRMELHDLAQHRLSRHRSDRLHRLSQS